LTGMRRDLAIIFRHAHLELPEAIPKSDAKNHKFCRGQRKGRQAQKPLVPFQCASGFRIAPLMRNLKRKHGRPRRFRHGPLSSQLPQGAAAMARYPEGQSGRNLYGYYKGCKQELNRLLQCSRKRLPGPIQYSGAFLALLEHNRPTPLNPGPPKLSSIAQLNGCPEVELLCAFPQNGGRLTPSKAPALCSRQEKERHKCQRLHRNAFTGERRSFHSPFLKIRSATRALEKRGGFSGPHCSSRPVSGAK
jgi:hypothetical protein